MALPQSPCDFIPASQVIALTKMRLEISTANYDGYFKIEIDNLIKKMYSPAVYGFNHTLQDICDNSIKIPAGARTVLGIQFCKSPTTTDTTDTVGIAAIPNNFYLWQGLGGYYPVYGNHFIENYFTKQGGYLYFTKDTDETLAIVWWEGFSTDDNGIIMIPEYFESFLSWGLCAEFLLKKPMYIGGNFSATQKMQEKYFSLYRAEKAQIKGNDQITRFDNEKKQLRFAMNKMNLRDFSSWSPFFLNSNNAVI